MQKAKKSTAKKKSTRAKKKTAPKTETDLNNIFKEVVRESKRYGLIPKGGAVGKTRPYTPTTRFNYGERIEHPAFGMGVVQTIKAKKVEVVFADKNRVLVHAAA